MNNDNVEQSNRQAPPVSTETLPIDSRDARLVVNLSLAPLYRVWLAMQYINKQWHYSGWFPLDQLNRLRLANLTGLSWHTIRVLLSHGTGVWWWVDSQDSQIIHFKGQVAIARYLAELALSKGVLNPQERGIRCAASLDILNGSKQEFVISLFDLWISARCGSRGYQARYQDLADLWGHSIGQVRRWVAASQGTHKERCRGFLEITGVTPDELETIDPAASGIEHGFAGTQDGMAGVVYDRANRYHAMQNRTRPSKAGKTQRAVNRAGESSRREIESTCDLPPAVLDCEIEDQASELLSPVVPSRTNYWRSLTTGLKAYFQARHRRPRATLYRHLKTRYRGSQTSSLFYLSRPAL